MLFVFFPLPSAANSQRGGAMGNEASRSDRLDASSEIPSAVSEQVVSQSTLECFEEHGVGRIIYLG